MSLRILTYKRTHIGDPDSTGQFGINDCMGRVRNRRFDAVIGVGGTGPEPRSEGIAGKLTWVGIGPRRVAGPWRGDIVSFEHFMLFDTDGPDFRRVAPNLARRLFDGRVRVLIDDYTHTEFREALGILQLARKLCGATSKARASKRIRSICRERCVETPNDCHGRG
ncbi:hypothetical protein [Burkholderia ubonensis]|uniref:hypothetical protein n=1 Tax=Burkholderia ubonensis TaxID=101571 RepID=UPI0012F7C190|nr:hypothetical protein [Burkholderia ubonensis]